MIIFLDMQDSLNNFEIRHLINKNIKNYPNPFEIAAPPPPPPEDLSLKVKAALLIYAVAQSISLQPRGRRR